MIHLAAAAAATFNLVCTGTIESESFYGGKKTEPYSYTYRLNLDSKKWCEQDCKVLHHIADVQPGVLVLSPRKDIDTATRKEFTSGEINRETGRQTILATSGRRDGILIMKWEGQCEKAPFSGFPTLSTKF